MTPATRLLHPARSSAAERARALYHAVQSLPPEDGTALLAEALELAERHGIRDPELDGFAVLRQACCEATWALEVGGSLEVRLRRADAILRAAVCAVDDEEDQGTCFRMPETEGAR